MPRIFTSDEDTISHGTSCLISIWWLNAKTIAATVSADVAYAIHRHGTSQNWGRLVGSILLRQKPATTGGIYRCKKRSLACVEPLNRRASVSATRRTHR